MMTLHCRCHVDVDARNAVYISLFTTWILRLAENLPFAADELEGLFHALNIENEISNAVNAAPILMHQFSYYVVI